jgi:hypothetical protein
MDMARGDDRDPVAPGGSETGEYVGDSPGEPFEVPDEPVAVDEPGTTAQEHGERSLERRLAMDEPDVSSDRAPGSSSSARPLMDDDVATEDLVADDLDADPDEADLDRTGEEVGEQSSDPSESAEESAMHVEPE